MSDPLDGFYATLDGYIGRAVAPLKQTIAEQAATIERLEAAAKSGEELDQRIADLEARGTIVIRGAKGESGTSIVSASIDADGLLLLTLSDGSIARPGRVKGTDGVSAKIPELPDIAGMVNSAVSQAVAAIPVPKNGERGKDGTSVDLDDVATLVKDAVDAAVGALPKPKDGTNGINGENGVDGKSIDPSEVFAMITEAVDALPRPKDGAPGKDGENGKSILSAVVDGDGALVLTASDGTTHKAGIVRGKDGTNGENGLRGTPGEAGRDAIAIRPLAGIDDAKSYPAGSWHVYGGGSWFAEKATEPLKGRNPQDAGWIALAVGEKSFAMEVAADERTIVATRTTSTGLTIERRFTLPIVLDRGIFAASKTYARGDGVTRSGSFWIAKVDRPKGLPGASDDWRLAVKCGTDGKGA